MLAQARRDKEATCPELLTSRRCRLVVVATEMGGRWSDEAADFLWQLALAKAREVPALRLILLHLRGNAGGRGCLGQRVLLPSLNRWWSPVSMRRGARRVGTRRLWQSSCHEPR